MQLIDRSLLALVRCWCFIRYPRVCLRTFKRSRVLPDPATPHSGGDKFLWRKMFDHNPLFTTACDKLAAKAYALSVCPELKTAAVLWTGRDAAAIPQEMLAGDVVVKANHGSRWNVMVRRGEADSMAVRRQASRWMRRRYGRAFGESAYKHARRCILVEEMLLEDGEPVRTEYKFHVSGGQTGYVYISRRAEDGIDQWCCLERDGRIIQPQADDRKGRIEMRPPVSFDRMRAIAEQLAAPFDHVRVDLYEIDGDVFFSELTVYPLSGQELANPHLAELRNRDWDLRNSWFLTSPQKGWRKAYASALRRWLDGHAPPDCSTSKG